MQLLLIFLPSLILLIKKTLINKRKNEYDEWAAFQSAKIKSKFMN